MIRALFFDSLNRIKWLALSYLCVVAVYSWEKIAVFVTDKPIPAGGSQWKGSLIAALCILAVSIIGSLIPYDKLTSQDAFWTTKPPRLCHLLISHSLLIFVTIVLPIALSESIISVLWGSPITTLSVFLQSLVLLASIVFILQILSTGSRNPFKSIGIIIATIIVTLVISSNFRQLLSPMTRDQHSSLALVLYIVSLLAAFAATGLCLKRKVEWPHTIAAISIAFIFATVESINVRSLPFEITQTEASPLPYQANVDIDYQIDSPPQQRSNRKDSVVTNINLGEIPNGNFLVAVNSQLVTDKKTPLRLNLNQKSVLTGFAVERNSKGDLSIVPDGAVRLASKQNLASKFQEEPQVSLDTLWVEYELESYKLLSDMAEEHYVKNGILSKIAEMQYYPVTEFSNPPTQVILHATTRFWSDFPSPFHKSSGQRNDLPNPHEIRRIYYIEYQDGSSRCSVPGIRSKNKDSLLPVSWQTAHLENSSRDGRQRIPSITAVYALDIRHVATWKSSIPIEEN